ncbi:MAG: cell division ATP-binding protein FtsE [Clostridiales bacterium]|jgi:cell division transport system ATP-binding protein|nr:cell division ATP-binding protein FtsE [Clostridiales bacterium]
MVRFSGVHLTYGNGTKAIKGIDFRVDDGEFIFLIGPSGSGKSTIVKLITGELRPTHGRVIVNGFNVGSLRQSVIPKLRRTVGVIFQDFRLIEKKTVYENVEFAMRVIGADRRNIKERVPVILDLVGLSHKKNRFPHELSGGEQQRVAIARALINNPRTIIADEPTGNLDPVRSKEIIYLLEKINSLGTTVITVTHERDIVNSLSKRVIAIDGGRIISDQIGGYFAL